MEKFLFVQCRNQPQDGGTGSKDYVSDINFNAKISIHRQIYN